MPLAEKIRAIELRSSVVPRASRGMDAGGVVPTGWTEIDEILGGGLLAGALHEWFGVASPGAVETADRDRGRWTPPLAPLVHLAWRFLDAIPSSTRVVWVGEPCFPYPHVLVRDEGNDRRLLESSLFVSPRNDRDRLWAVDLSLRSPVVGLVIADGSRFDMAATRRLQLVAKSRGTPVIVVRPPREIVELSAAQTRWSLEWRGGSSDPGRPRWTLNLMRCKGARLDETRRSWVVEWDRAACALHLSAPMVHRHGVAEAIAGGGEGSARLDRSA